MTSAPELAIEWHSGDLDSPFVLAENGLDRATDRDRSRLFAFLYGDAADWQNRVTPERSRSQIDFDFACLVAKYCTRDPYEIESVMRYADHAKRPKWDEKRPDKEHGGYATWLLATVIHRAIKATRHLPEPETLSVRPEPGKVDLEPSRARTLREVWSDPDARKAPVAVIPRLAWRGRLTVYTALDKGGKSTLVAAGVAAMTRGDSFLGEPTERGTCLWALLEEHVNDWAVRAQRFGTDHDNVYVLEHPGDPVAAVRAEVERLRPAVLVVDVLTRYAGDRITESGSAAQWTQVMVGLQEIARQLDVAVIVLHHARKSDGAARDSSEITARADIVIEQRSLPEDGVQRFTVRGRWDVKDFAVRLVKDRHELTAGGESIEQLTPQRRKVRDALKPPMAYSEWLKASEVPPSTFLDAVRWLTAHDHVEQAEDGTYSPAPGD